MDKKRIFDLTFSVLGLAVSAVPMLVIASVLKITTKDPVLFKQKRVGQDGRIFDIYKLNTMSGKDDGTRLSSERVTKVGRFLRAYGLDESPQIFNIIKGDMSVVGPRPHIFGKSPDLGESSAILKVRPGLTGVYQVHSGYHGPLPIEQRNKMEEDYANGPVSLRRDFTLVVQTIPFMLFGKHDNTLVGEKSLRHREI